MEANITNVTKPSLFCSGLRFLEFKQSNLIFANVISSIVLNVILGVFATFANSLMIFIVWKNPSLQTPTNVMFTHLAFTDVLVGMCTIPLSVICRFYQTQGIFLCKLGIAWGTSAYLFCVWSTSAICAVSIDRYVATFYPVVFRRNSYHQKRKKLLLFFWFCWTIFTIFPASKLIGFLPLHVAVLAFIVIVMSTIVFCYARIIRWLKQNSNRLQKSELTAASLRKMKFDQMLTNRRCLTAGLLTLAFILTYSPRVFFSVIFFFAKEQSFEIVYLSGLWSEAVIYLNSAINPVLYFWRLENVRTAVCKLFEKSRNEGEQQPELGRELELTVSRERYIKRLNSFTNETINTDD